MTINWTGAAGTALSICVLLGPFVYKDRRTNGASRVRAILDVGLIFLLLVLWIVGGSNALYGLGMVVDEPPQILGSGGYDPGRSHTEHWRPQYLAVGLVLMAVAWTIGKLNELRN
jgi:hypothetical protein